MPTILAIETATTLCSVALVAEQHVLAELTLNQPRSHATHLPDMIQQVVHFSGLEWKDLEGIAVSMGPGSYTGLRIGVSAAKAVAFAHEKPLVGVNTLRGLAQLVHPFMAEGDTVCSFLDARRDEVYAAAFMKKNNLLEWEKETTALVTAELKDWFTPERHAPKNSVWLVGDGARKCLEPLQVAGWEGHLTLLPESAFFPTARAIAQCVTVLTPEDVQNVRDLEPFYYKAFVAAKPSRTIRERTPQN
ncbi:MAG TPA: tRNA (adenosine(37)-N6)-threonylcarbamoyltransferase complex dimerization subunit type 1 TsaB [Rhodothermales bacterium]|nr:tRNA (adenosine(37)-N6)-threonylcarbamoyltransferase complex dimerization subunit type 1 TsaB [Rhodothermales bacterium]HRR07636.1 tRNA (adenosine(37)-N6)-threonylcarbamoyltransferase complex dimerization subunit type 1 TsaB [Rhodothermales bacterium]